jgi:hypothetical protein
MPQPPGMAFLRKFVSGNFLTDQNLHCSAKFCSSWGNLACSPLQGLEMNIINGIIVQVELPFLIAFSRSRIGMPGCILHFM